VLSTSVCKIVTEHCKHNTSVEHLDSTPLYNTVTDSRLQLQCCQWHLRRPIPGNIYFGINRAMPESFHRQLLLLSVLLLFY